MPRRPTMARTASTPEHFDPTIRWVVTTDMLDPSRYLSGGELVLAGSENPPDAAAVAGEFLTSVRLPRYCRTQRVSIFPVDGEATPRVVDWFVAFESDWQTWDPTRISLAGQLASIVAVERGRVDERVSGSGILAQEFVRSVIGGATPADILAQMHVIGLDTATRYAAIVAATSGETLRLGELRPLLREVLDPVEITLGVVENEAIALVEARTDKTDAIRRAVQSVIPGLVGSGTTIGVSAPTAAADIRSAIEEARYARRLAEGRGADCSVVGHDELATLTILLANVPDDVRRMFTSRLLDPLTEYDDQHNSDLISTLSVYLDTNGAWTRCAEQLHMHVNSVRYRIQRIEELTGRDLSRLEDRIEFYLALRLR
ncbi:helix-turn-helix domain-containing protein [Rhodococcus fascians]|nr:helix-turn-helix domain-containing protein [Rhodococcus fascians]